MNKKIHKFKFRTLQKQNRILKTINYRIKPQRNMVKLKFHLKHKKSLFKKVQTSSQKYNWIKVIIAADGRLISWQE